MINQLLVLFQEFSFHPIQSDAWLISMALHNNRMEIITLKLTDIAYLLPPFDQLYSMQFSTAPTNIKYVVRISNGFGKKRRDITC